MTVHSERYIGPCFLLVASTLIAPAATIWLRTVAPLPPGYGAEGDRRRANPIPALVRPSVEALSAECAGSWVKECIERGAWVYELHCSKDGKESVIHLTANGSVIPSKIQDPEQETHDGSPSRCRSRS